MLALTNLGVVYGMYRDLKLAACVMFMFVTPRVCPIARGIARISILELQD